MTLCFQLCECEYSFTFVSFHDKAKHYCILSNVFAFSFREVQNLLNLTRSKFFFFAYVSFLFLLGVSFRADHNLQDLRTKLFPPELEKHKAEPEPAPTVPSPAKQKERSLSSLVVNSPKPSPQPSMNGRSKFPTSKSLVIPRQPAPPPEEASKKAEDSPKTFSSQETSTKGVSVNENQKVRLWLNFCFYLSTLLILHFSSNSTFHILHFVVFFVLYNISV